MVASVSASADTLSLQDWIAAASTGTFGSQGFGLGGALAASIAPPSASATLRHARRLVI